MDGQKDQPTLRPSSTRKTSRKGAASPASAGPSPRRASAGAWTVRSSARARTDCARAQASRRICEGPGPPPWRRARATAPPAVVTARVRTSSRSGGLAPCFGRPVARLGDDLLQSPTISYNLYSNDMHNNSTYTASLPAQWSPPRGAGSSLQKRLAYGDRPGVRLSHEDGQRSAAPAAAAAGVGTSTFRTQGSREPAR